MTSGNLLTFETCPFLEDRGSSVVVLVKSEIVSLKKGIHQKNEMWPVRLEELAFFSPGK